MTPQQIIGEARLNFGELIALTLTEDQMLIWLNTAIRELYDTLLDTRGPTELRGFATTDSVNLTDGKASISPAWDTIITVATAGVELLRVGPAEIRVIDTNPFFQPTQSVWAENETTLFVRPDTIASVDATHLEAPQPVTSGSLTTELSMFNPRWNPGLVWLITSYAYAQEEDQAQADHYRGRFNTLISTPEAAA